MMNSAHHRIFLHYDWEVSLIEWPVCICSSMADVHDNWQCFINVHTNVSMLFMASLQSRPSCEPSSSRYCAETCWKTCGTQCWRRCRWLDSEHCSRSPAMSLCSLGSVRFRTSRTAHVSCEPRRTGSNRTGRHLKTKRNKSTYGKLRGRDAKRNSFEDCSGEFTLIQKAHRENLLPKLCTIIFRS